MSKYNELVNNLEKATTFTEGFAIIDELYPMMKERMALRDKQAKQKAKQAVIEQSLTKIEELSTHLQQEIENINKLVTDFENKNEKTVQGEEFAYNFNLIQKIVEQEQGNRKNSLALRKKYAQGKFWIVADISQDIQQVLETSTTKVRLSDDTLIKMLCHHPNESTPDFFRNVPIILDNAIYIDVSDGVNVVYFSYINKYYKVTIKATKDKTELYLTTIFEMREKDFQKKVTLLKNKD